MEAVLLSSCSDTERLDRFADELRRSGALTPKLIARALTDACTRLPGLMKAGKTTAFDRLVLAEAWTDAALSLVELELPMWKPRRLIYDGGEWLCSLSRHSAVPIEFDEPAEARHEERAIAIMLSLVEAKRHLAARELASIPSFPQVLPTPADSFCCDNFR